MTRHFGSDCLVWDVTMGLRLQFSLALETLVKPWEALVPRSGQY